MASLNTISPPKLMRLIGTDQAPVLIDVRTSSDFAENPFLIPTAFHCPHDQIAALAPDLSGQTVIIICHKGLKLSHGSAALLRARGVSAISLEGGMVNWIDAGLPTIPVAAIADGWTGTPTRWVTRHRPKIDRIACPWLIRRFIDPKAEFLFVPPSEVAAVADRFDAIPFDTPDAPWTHDKELCTFDSMLTGFGLNTPPLGKMAAVIRAADTGDLNAAPEAAGLLALSVGLSRVHKDDLTQMEAGFVLYDALYRWARDGAGETHSWPEHHTK